MRVLVRERQEGKTTILVDWLMGGRATQGYPGWSRVIVCPTNEAVVHTDRMLKRRMNEMQWSVSCDRCLPHPSADCREVHARAFFDARKCIWGARDLRTGLRGIAGEGIEIVVDDLHMLINHFLGWQALGGHEIAGVAINGELWQ